MSFAELLDYFEYNWEALLELTAEHAWMSFVALAVSIAIGFPLGLLLLGRPRIENFALTTAGILYTIPSLALLAILVPITGLGIETVVIALVLYSLLVIMRNVLMGLTSTPAELLDAAEGIGLNPRQVLWRVRMPLALPYFAGGIRVAGVSIIGMATLAAWVGAGGLGTPIFRGIAQIDFAQIFAGTILVFAIGVVFDLALALLERSLKKRMGVER
ncbi:ABC transporter permease [Leucobacter weissii]|uniref:ABC transporter permease n=1 Tax=Leucobacter weissii TaxID=1983706 RepID=A0A939MGA7_9MICO|nr:ABC transporter permease [Leucobacter weissii]MBO1900344.1 ABC transporter permease [Leucobacter weissii]